MNDRGKAEFKTMDFLNDIESKDISDDSIEIKETAKEHFAKRFLTVPLGKANIHNAEEIARTSMANAANRDFHKFHSGVTIDDNVQRAKQEIDKVADSKINSYAKKVRNRKSDLENYKANKFLKDTNNTRDEKKHGLTHSYQPKPMQLNDEQKYHKALTIQDAQKKLEAGRKKRMANAKSSFKVVKEFAINGEFLNKFFEE